MRLRMLIAKATMKTLETAGGAESGGARGAQFARALGVANLTIQGQMTWLHSSCCAHRKRTTHVCVGAGQGGARASNAQEAARPKFEFQQ